MEKGTQREVVLPEGKPVIISNEPQDWWENDNHAAYLDPRLLAPDVDQPRRHMDAAKLRELEESIAEQGVRSHIVITPRHHAPWVKVASQHANLPFAIVGGHRRTASAIKAALCAVPVIIRIYTNEADYRIDASLSNKDHDDLTPIEEGIEIRRLHYDCGVTLEKLKKAFGCSVTHLYNRMNLTKLHPGIQELLNPAVPDKKKLSTILAGELGSVVSPTVEELEEFRELFRADIESVRASALMPCVLEAICELDEDDRRFEFQKMLLAVIHRRKLSAVQAAALIAEHKLQLSASQGSHGATVRRFEPRKRKDILANIAKSVTGSLPASWRPEEIFRIFQNASREEVDEFIVTFKEALEVLQGLQNRLIAIRDSKKATRPEVLRILQKPREEEVQGQRAR